MSDDTQMRGPSSDSRIGRCLEPANNQPTMRDADADTYNGWMEIIRLAVELDLAPDKRGLNVKTI